MNQRELRLKRLLEKNFQSQPKGLEFVASGWPYLSRIIFHLNDFSIPYRGPWVEMKQLLRISPNGSKLIIEREETPVARIFNKEILLESLLSEAEKSGCEIANETIGMKAVNTDGGVVVTLQSKGKQREVRTRIASAADGVNSRIVHGLGLNKERKLYGTPRVVSYILQGVKASFPNAFIMFQGKAYSGGQIGYGMPKAPRKKGDSKSLAAWPGLRGSSTIRIWP